LLDHVAVEVEGFAVTAVRDGDTRPEVEFSPLQDGIGGKRPREERRGKQQDRQPDLHVLQCSTPETAHTGIERAYADLSRKTTIKPDDFFLAAVAARPFV
jgi:hypothetical protein